MFDYVLNCVDGDDGILRGNQDKYAPAYRRTTENRGIISGWDPLWALECVAAREQYVAGYSDPYVSEHWVNRISSADMLSIWNRIKALQGTELFLADSSLLTNCILSNFQPGASLNRYFQGSMQTSSYDPNTTEYYMRGLASGNPMLENRWRLGIWPRLRDMNYMVPSQQNVQIGIPNPRYNEIEKTVEVDRVGDPSCDVEEGWIYNHESHVSVTPIYDYPHWALSNYWKAKWQVITGTYGLDQLCKVSYPDGDLGGHSSQQSAYGIFCVYREKTDLETFVVNKNSTYVIIKVDSMYDRGDYFLLKDMAAMVPSILTLSGVQDDVTIADHSWVISNMASIGRHSGGLVDRLSVKLVEYYPICKIYHACVDNR